MSENAVKLDRSAILITKDEIEMTRFPRSKFSRLLAVDCPQDCA